MNPNFETAATTQVRPSGRPSARPLASLRRRRVIVIGNMLETLVWFRGPLMQSMIAHGHEVVALVPMPDASSPLVGRLEAMGVSIQSISLDRVGFNPFADTYTVCTLVARLRRLRPDVVLAYMIKPIIYGSLAARLAGVPAVYSIVEGAGYIFSDQDDRRILLRGVVKLMYRLALATNRRVFFLNPDNIHLFQRLSLIRHMDQAVLLNGIGVDLDRFTPVLFPQRVSFLLIARLLRDKGVREFVAAARLVKARYPNVRFRLVGWVDDNPSAIEEDELRAWVGEGSIEYLGKLDDVRVALANSSVFVLPSYHEGLPRTTMEAMAMGRPIITTDAPGCRETVIDGRNGYLVPVRDVPALARAMLRFVEQPELIAPMGGQSRRIAEAKYDVHQINQCILRELDLV
jgi:glycosyltransferase involved in cell wall biosynthesis